MPTPDQQKIVELQTAYDALAKQHAELNAALDATDQRLISLGITNHAGGKYVLRVGFGSNKGTSTKLCNSIREALAYCKEA